MRENAWRIFLTQGESMKIFITEFEWDGVKYDGPKIYAKDFASAQAQAEYLGVTLLGTLEAVVDEESVCESVSEGEGEGEGETLH